MALLANASSADFGFLREHLGVSDSDLSKQMAALAEAGYVAIKKAGHGRGGVTTYRITRVGSQAYTRHRDALRALLSDG
jgi:DNA-binding transcriptional ArsR family regulator